MVVVSFGSPSRNVKSAMKICRKEGLKVGILRPVTLWPFPSGRIAELAKTVKKFMVVEVNMGQMVRDVRLAVNGAAPVEFFNRPVGNPPEVDDIVNKIKEIIK